VSSFVDASGVGDEDLVLREPGQFKALGHPLRHRLLVALRQRPATLAQLAAAVGAAKGTVGYHIKILQEAGLVRVAHARQVRGGTERYLEPSSPGFRIARDASVGGEFLVRAALAEMLAPTPHTPDRTILRHLRLTGEHARRLVEELAAAADQATSDAHGTPYGLLLSLYRADIPTLPDDNPDLRDSPEEADQPERPEQRRPAGHGRQPAQP
jgi:DNA-binding transcriptional ArsR family regulator